MDAVTKIPLSVPQRPSPSSLLLQVQLTKVGPQNAFENRWPATSKPANWRIAPVSTLPKIMRKTQATQFTYIGTAGANIYTVLVKGFENVSYPLSSEPAHDKQVIKSGKDWFMLHKLKGTPEPRAYAEDTLGVADAVAKYASLPVGYVADKKGEIFLICKISDRMAAMRAQVEGADEAGEMGEQERLAYSHSVVRLLRNLHSDGFGCGGLRPDAVDCTGREARILDPSTIFAIMDSEPEAMFHEAAVTLSLLAGAGYARLGDIRALAAAYLSSSPVCRDAIASRLKGKKVKLGTNGDLIDELERQARKLLNLF